MKLSKGISAMLLLGMVLTCCGNEPPKDSPSKGDPVSKAKSVEKTKKPAKDDPVDRNVLLLGLDGATWDVMDPLLEKGRLPNFAKLISAGARAPLKTYEPTLSPLIWTTIATGVGPPKHGIQGFTAKVPGTEKSALVTSNMRKVKAIWNIASEADITSGTAGWWATYPAEEVKGFIISDQASSLRQENYAAALDLEAPTGSKGDPRSTFPSSLAKKLEKQLNLSAGYQPKELERFGNFDEAALSKIEKDEKVDKEDIISIFKFAYLIDKSFIEASLLAVESQPVTLMSLYLNGLDAAEHHFWKFTHPEDFEKGRPSTKDAAKYAGLIDEYYVYMDEVLGRFMEKYPLDSSLIIVVSDHGHESNPAYDPASEDHFNRVCSGTHDKAPDGVIIVAGKDIAPGAKLREPTVFDVAPTVLTLLGLPKGEDMLGRPLEEIYTGDFKKAHPVRTVSSHGGNSKYSPHPVESAMTDALTEKLKGLGYIE